MIPAGEYNPWHLIQTEENWKKAVEITSWQNALYSLRDVELHIKKLELDIEKVDREIERLNDEVDKFVLEIGEYPKRILCEMRSQTVDKEQLIFRKKQCEEAVAIGKKVIEEARLQEEKIMNDEPIDKKYFKEGLR